MGTVTDSWPAPVTAACLASLMFASPMITCSHCQGRVDIGFASLRAPKVADGRSHEQAIRRCGAGSGPWVDRDSASVAMVRAWHAGAVVLIVVLLAQPAHRTKSMIGAVVSGGQQCEWRSVAILTYCAYASHIWPSCDGSCPKAESGLSSNINRATLRPTNEVPSTAELLLRSLFCGLLRPAQVAGPSECPWLPAGCRDSPSFWQVHGTLKHDHAASGAVSFGG